MEIERTREPTVEFDQSVPSAPDFDQESLSNAVDDLPELVERHRLRPSIWSRLKRAFTTRYQPMVEDEASPVHSELPPAYTSPAPNNRTADSILPADLNQRNSLLRKLYWLFTSQMSLFTGLCALFYYVPHIRQMFRKTFADKVRQFV